MQQIMRIGDDLVPADDDIIDIGHTGAEITNVAQKYKTDVLAVIGKGDKHHLVTQHHEYDTMLEQDIIKIVALVETVADTYKVQATDIATVVKMVVDEGE